MNAFLVTWYAKNHRFISVVLANSPAEAERIIDDEYGEGRTIYARARPITKGGLISTSLGDPDLDALTKEY